MPPLGVVTISCAGDFVSFVLQRADGPDLRGFRQGLKESGYVEGDNVTVVQSTTKATTVYCAAAGDQGW